MLREKTIARFVEMLDRTRFTSANFRVRIGDGMPDLLTISFRPKPEFEFTLRQYSNKFYTEEAPGDDFLTAQKFARDGISEAISAVYDWATRVKDEYIVENPALDELDALRDSLEQKLSEHSEDLDKHFSREEIVGVTDRLDAFESRLAELLKRTEGAEKSLSEAHQEIAKLKEDLVDLPKGVWYRVAGSRILKTMKAVITSKEGREFAVEAAKQILLPGPK